MTENIPKFIKSLIYICQKPSNYKYNNFKEIYKQTHHKLSKDKKRFLKAARDEGLILCQESSIRLTVNFLSETMETRMQ